MIELRNEVHLSAETLPIQFSSMKQTIKVVDNLSAEELKILLAGACPEGRVCPRAYGDCIAGRVGNVTTCVY